MATPNVAAIIPPLEKPLIYKSFSRPKQRFVTLQMLPNRRQALWLLPVAAIAVWVSFTRASPALAQKAGDASTSTPTAGNNIPAYLSADEVVVDEDLGLVTAQGNVEITQAERFLRADSLTYNRRSGVITAAGNVTLIEPTGEVHFVDFIELTNDMRDGALQNLRALLADQSRFAAVTARRSDGTKTVMRRATYTPCEPCAKDPTRQPLWQLRASRITHDTQSKEVVYNDAWLDIAGVPVLYTPYFSHPDGTEKRKSGFLIPELSSSSTLGTAVAIPYFWVLTPSSDVTVIPVYQTSENPMLMGDYRQKFKDGKLSVQMAALQASKTVGREGIPENRGNVHTVGQFDIDDDWRWGFDATRATDKTFMDRYRIYQRFALMRQESNESRLYTEGFRNRSYAALQGFAFQSLRPEDRPAESPVVLPAAQYTYVGQPGEMGGYWSFDNSLASIYRSEGLRSQRATTVGGWILPYTTTDGSVYKLALTTQIDAFHTGDLDERAKLSAFRPESTGASGRVVPQMALDWRRPVARTDGSYRTVIEPIAGIYVSPNLSSQRQYPNEESRTVTFDDTNLFRTNRFTGPDRLESGTRLVYGVNTVFTRLQGGRLAMMVGQQYRPDVERAMPLGSGLETRRSDYVGRIQLAPNPWLSSTFRFQADDRTGKLLRQSVGVAVGPQAMQFSTSLTQIDRALQPTALQSIRQINFSLQGRIDENWSLRALAAQSLLQSDRGLLYAGGSLVYEDDCFVIGGDFLRRNIGREDIPPDTSIFFRIGFRNLGQFNIRGL